MAETLYNKELVDTKLKRRQLRAIGPFILLIPYTRELTSNGIYIPETAQSQQVKNVCFVAAVGDRVKNTEDIKEGACVIIPRHTGRRVYFENFEYYLVTEYDIIAVIDDVQMVENPDSSTWHY